MRKHGRYIRYSENVKSKRKHWLVLLVGILAIGIFVCCINRKDHEQAENSVSDIITADTTVLTTNAEVLITTAVPETAEYVREIQDEETTVLTTVYETEIIETTEQENPIATEVSEETKNTYSEVLDQYREVIMMNSADFLALHGNESEYDLLLQYPDESHNAQSLAQILELPKLRDRYQLVDGSTLVSFHYAKAEGDEKYSDPSVYYYAYYNIDDRRSDELLIGSYNAYRDDYSILAIYTSAYGKPRLLQSIRDDSRWHLTVYTDGTYCLDGSGGASVHYWHYYRLDSMFDLDENIASFTLDYEAPRGDYLATVIAEYENMLTPVDDLIWYPLMKE